MTSPPPPGGLQRLEYRGYDSAGVVVTSPKTPGLKMVKAKGRVRDLEAKIPARFKGTTGIAHTRWATHGAPSDVNAHPHMSADNKVAVVHNGIIDNAADLRRKLEADGVEFLSETDTEVLTHLIARSTAEKLEDKVRQAVRLIEARTASPCCTPTSPTGSWWPATAPRSSSASARRRCSSPPTSPPWSCTPAR